jgi:hypothetical protein
MRRLGGSQEGLELTGFSQDIVYADKCNLYADTLKMEKTCACSVHIFLVYHLA